MTLICIRTHIPSHLGKAARFFINNNLVRIKCLCQIVAPGSEIKQYLKDVSEKHDISKLIQYGIHFPPPPLLSDFFFNCLSFYFHSHHILTLCTLTKE